MLIQNLELQSTAFNKLIQELQAQSLYVTYEKRKDEMSATPTKIFIGKSGSTLSENDMVNITKVLSKNNIDMTDYDTVNVQNLSLLPASALIRSTAKDDQLRDI